MEQLKIKSISEAFSMQPVSHFTRTIKEMEDYKLDRQTNVEKIVLETIRIGTICGDPVEELYYVGYNFLGHKMFQYIAKTVNIHYENN